MIVEALASIVSLYVVVNVLLVAIRNYKAHQFFSLKAPWLPVVPSPGILSGHMLNVIIQNKNIKILDDLHKKYGRSFGLYFADQAWIATTDIELIKVLDVDESHKHVNRGEMYMPLKEFNESILQSKDDNWRRCRRAITPALTNHKVCSDEVTSDLKLVVNQLHASFEKKLNTAYEKSGKRTISIDVRDICQRYSLAIIFSTVFKQDEIINFEAEKDYWIDRLEKGVLSSNNWITKMSFMFPFLRPLFENLAKYHASRTVRDIVYEIIVKIVEAERAIRKKLFNVESRSKDSFQTDAAASKRRVVDAIIDAHLDRKITNEDLHATLWALLMAGYITTADSMTATMWLLALHPDTQEKLRQSIIENGIESEYLAWCLFESLRCYSPAPFGAGRMVKEDIHLNGRVYPAGAYLFPTIPSIHRDESYWPEADKYKPERWSERKNFHQAAFMAFGLGPRNCPGGKLAMQEMKLFLQMLLLNYRLEKYEETSLEFNVSSPLLIHTIVDHPIKLRIVPLS